MSWMWLVPAFPILGYLILAVAGRRMPAAAVAVVGTGSVGLSMVASAAAVWTLSTVAVPGAGASFYCAGSAMDDTGTAHGNAQARSSESDSRQRVDATRARETAGTHTRPAS